MKKVTNIINVCMGNFFEMYDFMVFGLFATYIAQSFFPSSSLYISLLLSFLTFGAGFLMRPLGAVILGAYIDKHGRRKGLILTLSLMAIGTITIAVTPGYPTIGVTAPLIILAGRLTQGFSAGAELGGVSIYLAELSNDYNRGFLVSWQSASQQLAIITAAIFGFVLNELFSKEFMANLGWRIPFVFGCLLLPVILIQRNKLEETANFKNQQQHPGFKVILATAAQHLPFLIICSLMVMLTTVTFYMITAYTPTFAKVELHLTLDSAFILTAAIALANFILLPLMGWLSDRIGRPRQLIFFSSLCVISAYPVMHWITNNPQFNTILAGELWFSLIFAGYNGAMTVALVEIVPPGIRVICFSFAYSLATAIYGGFTPAIATHLIHVLDNKAAPALWLTIVAACSLSAVLILVKHNKFVKTTAITTIL